MARQIVVGIDVGTFQTKVIIAEGTFEQNRFAPRIIGTGTAETKGVERGFIANQEEPAASITLALSRAEKIAGVKAKSAYVAFGGIGLESITGTGTIAISRADMEITDRDLALVLETAEKSLPKQALLNKRIINTIPVEYKIDGKPVWGQALGLKAAKLEVKALFITCLEHHLAELIKTVESAGVEVIDVVAAPIAASFVTVSKKQRRVGALLADIGAEIMSLLVFENNNMISLEVFPIGGTDITNDIALGLKVSLDDAETLKLGGLTRAQYSKKKLDEIVAARLGDCFELIENHLKKLGRDALLPAGIIMIGGAAGTSGIKNFAEEFLALPAQVAEIHFGMSDGNKTREPIWATACGLVLFGFNSDDQKSLLGPRTAAMIPVEGTKLFKKATRWISQFLP